MVTLIQLRTFIALADSGGFTQAAALLGMTQSAVSHTVTGLERELGLPLVERGRGGRGARLTRAGAEIVAHARRAVHAAERVHQEAAAAQGLASGRVRLGSFPTVSAGLLPRLLRSFRMRYPGITVVLFEGSADEVRTWVADRIVDVGVVMDDEGGVVTTPLCDDGFVAVVTPDDPLARQDTVSAADLAGEPFILSRSGCERVILQFFERAGVVLRPAYEVRDTTTILAMVREGLGVTMLSPLALTGASPGLHTIPLDAPATRRLSLAVAADTPASPAVRALIDEATASLGQATPAAPQSARRQNAGTAGLQDPSLMAT